LVLKVYHDHDENGSWTEVTGIKSYPEIMHRMDEISTASVVIVDNEGDLYSTWEAYDFIPMRIDDDAANVLFRGYLVGKKFEHDKLTLSCCKT